MAYTCGLENHHQVDVEGWEWRMRVLFPNLGSVKALWVECQEFNESLELIDARFRIRLKKKGLPPLNQIGNIVKMPGVHALDSFW